MLILVNIEKLLNSEEMALLEARRQKWRNSPDFLN